MEHLRGRYVRIIFEEGVYAFCRKQNKINTNNKLIFFSDDETLGWRRIYDAVGYVLKTSQKEICITHSKDITESAVEIPIEYIAYCTPI
ncbi:MAG: hypothetical protein COW88_02250 [Candidatus Lloydbacteria bacterium CG22_combo_CG10-13_8_21_14_all_47_15]|uniref:Uncharacterized protein n=1 Tax=Candidatus Lloydbacteria bacterium CG22_combo_CG10-13_8_21_14_all_47_15 TaxID=1974635 RepID=A0A2H0CU42_9BACT|nr:MAG: hypothetical protein COW88_02250 [Candidatus Lloydbacteria bacterium CG22_combo_CG10-13_8_21_14_all_47_15]